MEDLIAYIKRNFAFISFVGSLSLITFGGGMAVGALKVFPYTIVEQAIWTLEELGDYPLHNAGLRPEKFLHPAPPETVDGVTVNEPGASDVSHVRVCPVATMTTYHALVRRPGARGRW